MNGRVVGAKIWMTLDIKAVREFGYSIGTQAEIAFNPSVTKEEAVSDIEELFTKTIMPAMGRQMRELGKTDAIFKHTMMVEKPKILR